MKVVVMCVCLSNTTCVHSENSTGSGLARSKVTDEGRKWVWSHVTEPLVLEALAGGGPAGRVVVQHGSEEGGERAGLL